MEHRILGRTGLSVSVLGLGGSEIGDSDFDNVEKLLNSALDAGLNVVDTGECYGDSEEFIGRAISHRRSEFYLFTKVGHASGFEAGDWDPKMMVDSIDRSLKRLKTDCVDLIQLHSCDEGKLREGDAIAILLKAKAQGKCRFIGYSGDREDALYAIDCKVFDTLQTSINIADQQAISLTLPRAASNRMGVIAKRPIANVAWHNGANPPDWDYARTYWERLQLLQYAWADPADMNRAVSTAIRFVLAQSGVHTAIVGTRNPARWKQNAALLVAGELPPQDVEAIRLRWLETAKSDWVGQT
jgi:hypothetical protein